MFGTLGSTCAHFGWTFDYVMNRIPWAILQRMLIDTPAAPEGEKSTESKPVEKRTLTAENADKLMAELNDYCA